MALWTSLLGSSIHGILQARMLEWVALCPPPGELPDPGIKPMSHVSCTGRWVLHPQQPPPPPLSLSLSLYIYRERHTHRPSLVAQMVKNLLVMQETRVQSLGWNDALEKDMAIHSRTLAWRIPWTEETGRLQSMGLQRLRHD